MAPTPAQKDAGNYKKRHVRMGGLPISIENRKGSIRSGVGSDGEPWEVKMPADYGYIRGTEGADRDHVDVYLGPVRDAEKIWVVNQMDPDTGKFDEHKVLMGFTSRDVAESTYVRGFSDGKGRKRMGSVREMSLPDFKKWLRDGDTTRKMADGGVVPPSQDPERVKRNMQRMLDQGATPEEIEEYARLEGVTPEQVNPRSPGERVGDYFTDMGRSFREAGEGVVEAVQGKQDPRYADVPTFPADKTTGSTGTPIVKGFNDAALVTDTDEDYAAILKRDLEKAGRLIGSQKDENGYELLTYRGDDGKEYVAYVNKPGLDMADVNRELAAALPFAITGFGTSAALTRLGLGTGMRVIGTGLAEAATSLGRDLKAAFSGADFDPVETLTKAGVAGVGAGTFEGLSRPIVRAWGKIFGRAPQIIDPKTGKLTQEIHQLALEAGLDPADMDARLARALQERSRGAADPTEVGVDIRTGEFGIPTTKGQRTKSARQLAEEENIRRGGVGEQARGVIDQFDKAQKSAIDRAVDDSIGMSLAPHQGGKEPATLGTRIREGVQQARGDFKKMDESLWDETGPLYPGAGAFDTLPDILEESIVRSGLRPDPSLPAAHRAMTIVDDFAQGKTTLPPYKILGESKKAPPKPTLRDIQRRLLAEYMGAELGSADARAAKAVYDGFNDWIEDLANRGAIAGDPEGAAKLWVARAFHREMKGLFEPNTPAKKTLEAILDNNRTPETVVDAIVGRGGPGSSPSSHAVQSLNHLKKILGPAGADTWDDIRLAYWVKLSQGKNGETLTPRMLKKHIDEAFRNQKSVVNTLFSEDEQQMMRRLSRALEDVVYNPPNPSGTAYTTQAIGRKQKIPGPVEDTVKWRVRRASLANDLSSRLLWRFIAKKLPNTAGIQDFGARKVAQSAVDPRLTPKPGSSLMAPAGAIGALEFYDDIYGGEQ